MRATMAPLISDAHRATFISIESLAGRLGFAGLLAMFAWLIPDGTAIEWDSLSLVLRVALCIGIAGLMLWWLATRRRNLVTGDQGLQ